MFAGYGAIAQSGNITVINHTDYYVRVKLHAEATASCSGAGCDGFATGWINLPTPSSPAYPLGSTTVGPSDACAIGVGDPYCSTSFCSAIPTDFQWTSAEVIVLGSSVCWPSVSWPVLLGDNGVGCSGASTPLTYPSTGSGCGGSWSFHFTWSPSSGSPMDDVTVTIDQL